MRSIEAGTYGSGLPAIAINLKMSSVGKLAAIANYIANYIYAIQKHQGHLQNSV